MPSNSEEQFGQWQLPNCNSHNWRDNGVSQATLPTTGLSRVFLIVIQSFFQYQRSLSLIKEKWIYSLGKYIEQFYQQKYQICIYSKVSPCKIFFFHIGNAIYILIPSLYPPPPHGYLMVSLLRGKVLLWYSTKRTFWSNIIILVMTSQSDYFQSSSVILVMTSRLVSQI